MERPSGPPLGAATQSTGRPMPDVPPGTRPAPLNTNRRYQSNRLGSGTVPLSAGQVVTLAREAMKNAIEENKSQAAEASGVSAELKPGVTIDLSRKNIQRFPDEVVDIIKDELVRLALSHNQLATLPSRFAECSLLRYLNVRNNLMRDLPQCICQLVSLEILDLGRNKLRVLPPELAKLTNLKVLSVQKNRIEELPLCLADMNSLQVLKFEDNPIRFPPAEVLQSQASSPPVGSLARENEATEVTVTSQIKKYLKQRLTPQAFEIESGGEESSEGTETPKPIKRVASGRFPIKVNGTDVPDPRSPALPRPPPIPTRSHYRGLSQQNTTVRRSGVVPLAIASSNERVRSNSESVSRERERSGDMRRISLLNRGKSDLGTVDEGKSNNRFSFHSRGLSHGSAMQGNSSGLSSRSETPSDNFPQRTPSLFRLSSIPERKSTSVKPDPTVEGAKGILYALFQIHPLIQSLVGLTHDGEDKRSSLEAVFYNASFHVEELDRVIQGFEQDFEYEEQDVPRSSENVHSACLTCVSAYIHVCALLQKQTETLVKNTDPRYVRSLLLSLYGSLMEVRNASLTMAPPAQPQNPLVPPSVGDTIRPNVADKQATPVRDRAGLSRRRSRSGTVIRDTNLRVATNVPAPVYLNGNGRTMMSAVSATPRSGESFGSATSRGMLNGDFTEEDRLFENIFLHLQQSSEMALKTLPSVNTQFVLAMRNAQSQGNMDSFRQYWQILSQKCGIALQTAESLKARLSLIKLKEPGIRTQAAFWELCNAFINAYTELGMKIKEAKMVMKTLPLEVLELLRPLQKIMSKTSKLIQTSPWSFLPSQQGPGSGNNLHYGQPSIGQTMMPMTPASAALGPAVQATVPSTPQTASYNTMFSGNVFERADALLSMNSTFSSRAGTMTSAMASNMGSTEGSMTPSSIMSPVGSLTNLARLNNSKAVF